VEGLLVGGGRVKEGGERVKEVGPRMLGPGGGAGWGQKRREVTFHSPRNKVIATEVRVAINRMQ
jgi:hypothetical protein